MKFNVPNRISRPVESNKHLFIDLRSEVKELMDDHGFEIIIRKVNKKQRCNCWDHFREEATDGCKRCSGSGWQTTNIVCPTVKKKFIGQEQKTPAGQRESDTAMFFFLHNITLSEEDSILEVVTNDCGKIPDRNNYEIIKSYSIRDVEVYRANDGRVEFSRAYCSKSE